MKQGKNHYTPQEFARLFHIDKQTLIYYDNQGIFSPAFRSEKGYRYYEAAQILPFAELLSLRNLHISGAEMGVFNQHPSRGKLIELLSDKVRSDPCHAKQYRKPETENPSSDGKPQPSHGAGHADSQASTPHAAQSPLPCQNIFPRCLSKECPSHHGVCRSPFRQRFGNRRQPSRKHARRLVRTLRLPPAADLAPCAKPRNGESPHPPRRTLSDLHLSFAAVPSSECRPFNHRKYDAGPLPFPRRSFSRHTTSG